MSRLQILEKEYGLLTQRQINRAQLYTKLNKLKKEGCLLHFVGYPQIPCRECILDSYSQFKKLLISVDAAFSGSYE